MFYLTTTSLIAVWCTLEVASHNHPGHHQDFVPNTIVNGIDDGLHVNNYGNQKEDKGYELLVSTKDHIRCEKCEDDGSISGRMFLKDKGVMVNYVASKAEDGHHQVAAQTQGVVKTASGISNGPVYMGQNQPANGNWVGGVIGQQAQRLTQPTNNVFQTQSTAQVLPQRANFVMDPTQQSLNQVGSSLNSRLANLVMASNQQSINPAAPPNPQLSNFAIQPPQLAFNGLPINTNQQLPLPSQLPQRQAPGSTSELMDSIFQMAMNSEASPVGAGDGANPLGRFAIDQQRKIGNYVAGMPQVSPAGNQNGNILAKYTLGNDIGNSQGNPAVNYLLGGSARYTQLNNNDIPGTLVTQPLKLRPDGSYEYGFATDRQSRQEIRSSDGNVAGRYSFIAPDGSFHGVKYTAGKEGFVPEVQPQFPLSVSSVNGNQGVGDQLTPARIGELRTLPVIVMTNPQQSAKAVEVGKAKDDDAARKDMMDELAKSIAKYVKGSGEEEEEEPVVSAAVQDPAPLK